MSIRRMMLYTLSSKIKVLVLAFKVRVLNDLGLFESETCLETKLTQIDNQNILDNSSLIVTPNGYKESKLYSVVPSDASGDIDVVRATRGTRVNSDGFIENVPYNIFVRSEEFDNTIWSKTNVSVTANTINSPINNLTADTLRIGVDVSSLRHRFNQNGLSFASNTTYTTSFYLKKAQHRWIQLVYVSGNFNVPSGPTSGDTSWANFDLENGVIGNTGSGATATITDAGNGWYRCSLQGTTIAGGTLTGCEILTTNNTNSGRYPTYQSSVAEDVCYMWGGQLVLGTQAKTYVPVSTGFNIPRIDYSNGSCPSILVEPQRTNQLLQSENLSTSPWGASEMIVTENVSTSPSGLPNADRIQGTGVSSVHQINQSGISYVNGTSYTFSFYIKKDTNDFIQISLPGATFNGNRFTNFNINTGVVGSISANVTASIVNAGNGWYRCVTTSTATSTLSSTISIFLITSSGSTRNEVNTLTTSVFVWGGQIEVGTNVTSYISTTTGTISRNADTISKSNITSLIGQTEGTIFVDYNKVLANDTFRNIISITDGTSVNAIEIWDGLGAVNLGMILYSYFANNVIKSSGIGQTSISPSGRYKICVTYLISVSLVNFKIFINGVKLDERTFTYTAFSNPLSKVGIGNRNTVGTGVGGHTIDYISKTAITDAQAITLTTL